MVRVICLGEECLKPETYHSYMRFRKNDFANSSYSRIRYLHTGPGLMSGRKVHGLRFRDLGLGFTDLGVCGLGCGVEYFLV